MEGMLNGIRVLEVANWVAGPSAGAILADLGADVIKVEHPETGDPARSITVSTQGVVGYTGGLNTVIELLNRGKRSIAANLEHPEGQQAVRDLAKKADVLITNLLPQRQERYGLRYEDLSADNPRLVYMALTGYGPLGAENDRAGFDYAAFWARSGIMGTLGERDTAPVQQRPGMGDQTTSLALTAAIGLALYERERSGKGQRVDCSLLHTALWVEAPDLLAAARERKPVQRPLRSEAGNPLFNYYQTQDRRWLQLVMIASDSFWPGFCRAIDDEALTTPEFGSHALRAQNGPALVALLDRTFARRPLEEWAERLDRERCIWAPVQTLDQVVVDPQVRANGYLTRLDHAEDGAFDVVAAPFQFARTPSIVRALAPEIGQHTEEVLLEAGYTWEDIGALHEAGAAGLASGPH